VRPARRALRHPHRRRVGGCVGSRRRLCVRRRHRQRVSLSGGVLSQGRAAPDGSRASLRVHRPAARQDAAGTVRPAAVSATPKRFHRHGGRAAATGPNMTPNGAIVFTLVVVVAAMMSRMSGLVVLYLLCALFAVIEVGPNAAAALRRAAILMVP